MGNCSSGIKTSKKPAKIVTLSSGMETNPYGWYALVKQWMGNGNLRKYSWIVRSIITTANWKSDRVGEDARNPRFRYLLGRKPTLTRKKSVGSSANIGERHESDL